MNGNKEIWRDTRNSYPAIRWNMESNSIPKDINRKDNRNNFQDQETMELYSRVGTKEQEIMLLREQIARASIKESHLLNEKRLLERKFSELRLALDEKQNEAVTTASNELALRKGDLEENLRLITELKIAEDERYVFMSSILGLLTEYGVWPRVTNASALTDSIKHLHDQLQLKIKTAHDNIAELNDLAGKHTGNRLLDNEFPNSGQTVDKLPNSRVHGFDNPNHYIEGHHLESSNSMPQYVQGDHYEQRRNSMLNHEMHQTSYNPQRPLSHTDGDAEGSQVDNIFDRSGINIRAEEMANEDFYQSPMRPDGIGSFASEDEGPGIEGFQIIGDAKPGNKLLGCGYPVRGTSLCMFQWVRHYPDGTRQYIDGATNPEYVVTADDVDKLIAVECIPMDEQGRQGAIVRLFANDQNKITCDPDMQVEIDTHISNGQAIFSVLILIDSSDWEPATLLLRRASFQVKVHKTQDVTIAEKFSKELLIKIPNGLSTEFVLMGASGSSYYFSTNNDVRLRDMLVLTMRIFQSKAMEEKRKGKA